MVRSGVSELPPDDVIFGVSPAMSEVRQKAAKICLTDASVLILGQGGTGKELLARWLHAHSPFAAGQFVKVNCAAIPSHLLESELFGVEAGAFTGANTARPGRVEQAHLGTLFLDEIGELSPDLQSKLLHLLHDGTFSRLGDHSERAATTRVICATSRHLQEEISAGKFRADLYYRINVLTIVMPTLAERREDIPYLAEHFRRAHSVQFDKGSEPFEAGIIAYLQSCAWPGNLRELSNSVARYIVIGKEGLLQRDVSTPRAAVRTKRREDLTSLKKIAKEAVREIERHAIIEALRANHWNRRKAAQDLKISYRALIYKIREAGLVAKRPASQS